MNSKFRILIVDDDPDVLEVTVDSARDAGFQVLSASDGAGAIALLETNEVHAMVSDIRMPGMTGLELYAKTKARNIPTILFRVSPIHLISTKRSRWAPQIILRSRSPAKNC